MLELQSLEDLERQINRLLDGHRRAKQERDELAERARRLEGELAEQRRVNEELQTQVEQARHHARDLDKEGLIKAKVDELLAKLEGF